MTACMALGWSFTAALLNTWISAETNVLNNELKIPCDRK